MNALPADAPGFEVPLHRSLTEPILLGGAPRTVAIANGTLAAAVGILGQLHNDLGAGPDVPAAGVRGVDWFGE